MKIILNNNAEVVVPQSKEEEVKQIVVNILFGENAKRSVGHFRKLHGGIKNSRWTAQQNRELREMRIDGESMTRFAKRVAPLIGRSESSVYSHIFKLERGHNKVKIHIQ